MAIKSIQFLAILLVAIALVPGGAHLASLPNKIGMDRDHYFIAQQVYRGWALGGIPLFGAMAATLALAVLSRAQTAPFVLAAVSFVLLLVTLIAFFIWVFPANQATDNWTVAPEHWRALRTQWEYGHAANAVMTLLALIAVVLSALAWQPDEGIG